MALEQPGQRDFYPLVTWSFSWSPTWGSVYIAVTVTTQQTARVIWIPPVMEVEISTGSTKSAVFVVHRHGVKLVVAPPRVNM